MKKSLVVAVCVVILGFFLRLRVALFADLWLDEVFSWSLAQLPLVDLIFSKGQYWDFVHPPLYYILLKLWMLGGDSETWMRSLSLLFYVGNSVLLFLIGRKLFSTKSGLVVLALYAVNPFFVNLDFQVRMYAMAVFFQLLFLWFFVSKYLKKTQLLTRDMLILGGLLALAFYVDYSAAWLVLSVVFRAFFFGERKKQKYFWLVIGTFVSLTSYQLVVLYKTLSGGVRPGSVPADMSFAFIFEQVLNIIGILDLSQHWFKVICVCAYIFFTFVFLKLRKKESVSNYWLLLAIVVLPIFVSLVFSKVVSPIFLSRNMLISAVAVIFFVSGMTENVFSKVALLPVTILILVFLLQSASLHGFKITKGFKEIVNGGRSVSNPVILYLPQTYHHPLSMYYLPRLGKKVNKTEQQFIGSKEDLQTLVDRKNGTFWVLYSDTCLGNKHCTDLLEYSRINFCSEVSCYSVQQI